MTLCSLLFVTLAWIAPQEQPTNILEFYDVRDLCGSPEDFGELDADKEVQSRERLERATQLLATMVRHVIGGIDPKAEIKAHRDGSLIVRTGLQAHLAVADTLLALRDADETMVLMNFQLIRAETLHCDPILKTHGVEFDQIDPVGHGVYELEVGTTKALGAQLQEAGADILNAPSIATSNMDRWHIRAQSQLAYVADWTEVVLSNGQRVADPTVEVLHEGVMVDGRAAAIPGVEHEGMDLIGLTVQFDELRVKRPMASQQTPLGEIQVPETTGDRFRFEAIISEDTPLLLVGPKKKEFGEGPEVRSLLLVDARVIPVQRDPASVEERVRQMLEKRRAAQADRGK